jgi:hypothetical protein
MTFYSQDGLGPIEKLRARWRSAKLVLSDSIAIQEREGLGPFQATKVAAEQHNRKVAAMRGEARATESCPNCDHVISDGSVGSVTFELRDEVVEQVVVRVEVLARCASVEAATEWITAAKPWEHGPRPLPSPGADFR